VWGYLSVPAKKCDVMLRVIKSLVTAEEFAEDDSDLPAELR